MQPEQHGIHKFWKVIGPYKYFANHYKGHSFFPSAELYNSGQFQRSVKAQRSI